MLCPQGRLSAGTWRVPPPPTRVLGHRLALVGGPHLTLRAPHDPFPGWAPGLAQASKLLAVAWRHLLGQCRRAGHLVPRLPGRAEYDRDPVATDPKTSTLAFLEISLAQPQTGIYPPVSGWVGTVLGVPCPPRAGTEAPSSHGPVVTMPPGDFLPSALGCLSDQSGDSGPPGVSGWSRRQCVAPTPPAGHSAQLLCPAPGLEVGHGGPAGKARGALGDHVAGTWRGTMQGSQWKSGGGHVGSRWELGGSGGAVADRRGPREGHIGVTCRMPHGSGRTGASGTMREPQPFGSRTPPT